MERDELDARAQSAYDDHYTYKAARERDAAQTECERLTDALTAALARAEKAEKERDALAKVAHVAHREARFVREYIGQAHNHPQYVIETCERLADAHDAARKEAGL